jgi:hypothetical protein
MFAILLGCISLTEASGNTEDVIGDNIRTVFFWPISLRNTTYYIPLMEIFNIE